jgi:hypothetical protein
MLEHTSTYVAVISAPGRMVASGDTAQIDGAPCRTLPAVAVYAVRAMKAKVVFCILDEMSSFCIGY